MIQYCKGTMIVEKKLKRSFQKKKKEEVNQNPTYLFYFESNDQKRKFKTYSSSLSSNMRTIMLMMIDDFLKEFETLERKKDTALLYEKVKEFEKKMERTNANNNS